VSLEVRGLSKHFGEQQVLKDVNLRVEPGEVFVVMGPSGSGKSVLLKHIAGLEAPEAGEIFVNDAPAGHGGVMQQCRFAMVFQSGALLNSLTVAENVGLYLLEHRLKSPADIKRIVAEKLAVVGLQGVEDKYPGELSGGMKKRVAIARALVVEPQLILYDEPTSELDPLVSVVIGQEILGLKKRLGVTSVVVSHDRDLAFGIADRMAVLHEGQVLALGSPQDIRRNPHPLIQRFLRAEFTPAASLENV
jgi:phospholipid/cholesterol/gamma-HCH transport system ATP-binding protein